MFYNMIKPNENAGEDDDSDSDGDSNKQPAMQMIKNAVQAAGPTKLSEKGQKIRNKIKFVSKMLKMQKTLR